MRLRVSRRFGLLTTQGLFIALAIAGPHARAQPAETAESDSEREDASSAASGVEVIVVHGRSSAAIEPDVPASITQFDASTIQALGAQNIADLSRVTPNVNIVQPGATQATFFVRGVGLSDFSSNAAGAVTIFQDGVSLNAPAIQTGTLFDIESVEIVRGPQGSGPYRNASAGAILVRSRLPSGHYSAQLRSTLGRYDTIGEKGAVNALFQDYEGALEMPIVAEALSARFAFRLREGEPFKTNGCANRLPIAQRPIASGLSGPPGSVTVDRAAICGERDVGSPNGTIPAIPNGSPSLIPFGLDNHVGDQHNWVARGTLRLQPRDSDLDLVLSAHGSRLDQQSALGQAIGLGAVPFGVGRAAIFGGPVLGNYQEPDGFAELLRICGGLTGPGSCNNPFTAHQYGKSLAEDRPLDEKPYRGDYNRVGQETRDLWGGFLSGTAAFDVWDLELSGLASYDTYERTRDQDTDFTPDLLFEQVDEDEAWQTYHQLALAGEPDVAPIRWELGGLYLYEHLEAVSETEIRLSSSFDRDYRQRLRSYGTWVRFDWDFLDDYTLGGGVRFNWERKDFRYRANRTVRNAPLTPADVDSSTTWRTPTGEIILTYHVGEESALYAKYSRGFKAGHFNAVASENLDTRPADEEYNDAWEAGLRGSWLQGRLSAASAFFYYRYENYQIFLFRDRANFPPALEIRNAKQAEYYGAELEARLSPLRGWTPRVIEGLALSGTFGWVHGEYLDFQSAVERRVGSQTLRIPIDFSGSDIQNAPQFKISATSEWTLELGRWGSFALRYDMQWSDDVFFDASEGRGTIEFKGFQNPLPEYAIGQKAFFLHHGRLTYRTPTSQVEVAAFVRNLTDEVYKNFAFDAASFSGVVINYVGEPRTYGLELTVAFQ